MIIVYECKLTNPWRLRRGCSYGILSSSNGGGSSTVEYILAKEKVAIQTDAAS